MTLCHIVYGRSTKEFKHVVTVPGGSNPAKMAAKKEPVETLKAE